MPQILNDVSKKLSGLGTTNFPTPKDVQDYGLGGFGTAFLESEFLLEIKEC